MTELKTKYSEVISRRAFCRSAITAAAAIYFAKPSAEASEKKNTVKFYKNLAPGHIGVKADQRQAVSPL